MSFHLPPELLSQHIAILGKTGSGKTFTAKGIVETLLEEKRRVCVLDPTGVWYGLRSSSSGKLAGYPVAVFGGRHGDVAIAETSGGALAKIIASKNLPAVIDLSEMLIGGRHRFMTDFAEALYRDNTTPLHLVIDEADEFAPQNPLPETKRMLHHVDRIVRRGRVRGFRVMLITQRPAVLNKNVLTQANTLIAMRVTSPQDRDALRAWVHGQADEKQAKDLLASLARLKTGEGWVWAPELDMLQRVTFPKIHTFDSSRTPENDETVVAPTKLAAVDIGEIKASFAEIEKEAKTVVELKAEVARLTKELAKVGKEVTKTPPEPDESEIHRRISVAVETERWTQQQVIHRLVEPLKKISALVGDALLTDRGPVASAPSKASKREPHTPVSMGPLATVLATGFAPPRNNALRHAVAAVKGSAAGLPGPQQRILDALGDFEALGITRVAKSNVAIWSDQSPTSSAFGNNLGALRSQHAMIEYPAPGFVSLTDAGREQATGRRRIGSLDGLHSAWAQKLPRPQAAIVGHLIACYPNASSRDEIAEVTGASATSSAFGNNLGALRSLGLLDYPARGSAIATSLLFPEGLK